MGGGGGAFASALLAWLDDDSGCRDVKAVSDIGHDKGRPWILFVAGFFRLPASHPYWA